MRILVTGGAGFIGSHLAEYLLARGHEVVIYDDLSGGKRENIADAVKNPRCEFWYNGCRDIYSLARAAKDCEFVYHAASTVGVKRVLEDPKECIENIVESTRRVASLGIPGINFSTSEVYGQTTAKLSEDSGMVISGKARWVYAAAKLVGEHLWPWKSVRPFNVVGPRQSTSYGAVLPCFVGQAISGEPLTVHGDGRQVRTFIDVRDFVSILDELRDKEFKVVNVGGKHVISINDLAADVNYALGSKSHIEHVDYPYSDEFQECRMRVPDLSQLESLVGPLKVRPLSETIQSLADSLKEKQYEPVGR